MSASSPIQYTRAWYTEFWSKFLSAASPITDHVNGNFGSMSRIKSMIIIIIMLCMCAQILLVIKLPESECIQHGSVL